MTIIPTRLFYILAAVPLAIIAIGGGSSLAVTTAWIVLGLLVLVFFADGLQVGTASWLTFERLSPRQLYIDQPHEVEWLVVNRDLTPTTILLRDIPPENTHIVPRQFAVTIPPHNRIRLKYVLTASRRGDLAFGDLHFRVRGRLGLAWKQLRKPATSPIRCLPHLANSTAADLAAREALVRQTGSHRYRWRGTGTVFESLREYSTEDDIRWVDWKATARAQRPISRNFEAERHQQLILLIDGSRMMSTYCGQRTKFDVVIEAAVLAAKSATDQGDAVGLVVFSDKPDLYLHPRRDRTQVGHIMNALYNREAQLVEPDFEAAVTMVGQRNRRRSLIVLFTDVTVAESATRMSTYIRTLIPRHLPLVVTIADDAVQRLEIVTPTDAAELYQVGVANELQTQRDRLLGLLRSGGAVVLDSPADEIATRTIQTYLDLKRRVRL